MLALQAHRCRRLSRWRSVCILPFHAITVCIAICLFPSDTLAQGEHARRAAAELQVLIGDLKRLQEVATDSTASVGLIDRVSGNVSMLELLMRFADHEKSRAPTDYRDKLSRLRNTIGAGQYQEAVIALEPLLIKFPLIFPLPHTPLSNAQLSQAQQIHSTLCQGCHDQPISNVERPAYNLYEEASRLTPVEFTARMMVGVKGDNVTGIDNPLTDIQLINLIRLYQTNATD